MRNYTAFLIIIFSFCIFTEIFAQDYGIATYYDDSFHGRRTSSGEIYNKASLTAAYKKYQYGTILKVTRLDNKRSVRVRKIDNGPFIKGRLIELSKEAAKRLDMVGLDEVEVRVELVERGSDVAAVETNIEAGDVEGEEDEVEPYDVEEIRQPPATIPDRAPDPRLAVTPKEEKKETKPAIKEIETKPEVESRTVKRETPVSNQEKDRDAILVRKGNYKTHDLYKIQLLRPQRQGYGVQVAYISNYENVLKQIAELQDKWFKNILLSVEPGPNGSSVYKLILGPFPDEEIATSYKKQLKKRKRINGFVVDLSALKY